MAKHRPWAEAIAAVFTPMTSPAAFTSGPPEFPGFKAASVWITSSINLPERARMLRPKALTTRGAETQTPPPPPPPPRPAPPVAPEDFNLHHRAAGARRHAGHHPRVGV